MTGRGLAMVALVAAIGSASAQPAARHDFDPVGRWRFFHTDGKPFIARLAADQTAATDFGGGDGERGIWRWEGQSVRVIYTDGWDDLLSRTADGHFSKAGWSPEADRCGPPSNRAAAEQISADPGPPL